MSLPEVFYVDNFQNAFDYTVCQLSSNKGSQTCISREKLVMIAKEKGIEVYSDMRKRELVIILYKVMGNELLKYCRHVGVTPFSFMQKYDLLLDEIEEFSKAGLLEMTGELNVYRRGKNRVVNLYSADQYFGLDKVTISEWRKIINGNKKQTFQHNRVLP